MPTALTRKTDDPLDVRIYHICPLQNLASIIGCDALLPFNALAQREIEPVSIAYSHLQERRSRFHVPIEPGGTLHDYVPWSFAARSPMLYASARGALTHGIAQDDIIHLVSDVARVQSLNLSFVFTDGHPLLTGLTKFSNELARLCAFLDWPVLLDRWWKNSDVDTDRARRRQAEFLIQGATPWNAVRGIGVQTEEAGRKVAEIVQIKTHQPKIRVLPDWYY